MTDPNLQFADSQATKVHWKRELETLDHQIQPLGAHMSRANSLSIPRSKSPKVNWHCSRRRRRKEGRQEEVRRQFQHAWLWASKRRSVVRLGLSLRARVESERRLTTKLQFFRLKNWRKEREREGGWEKRKERISYCGAYIQVEDLQGTA